MKTFWKALGIAALAAAVPVRVKKDEESGRKTYQSLLLSVDVDTDETGKTSSIGINIGDGFINNAIMDMIDAKKEAELFADDPAEAVVTADEAQIIADETQDFVDEAQDAADEAQATADEVQTEEAQDIADEAQEIADEAQDAADEAQDAAEEAQDAAEEAFDPEA